MTPRELDKRLDALENRLSPEELLPRWILFFGNEKKALPVKGWRCEDHIFLREPGETDEALRKRVLSSTEKYKNPPNGQVFIQIV